MVVVAAAVAAAAGMESPDGIVLGSDAAAMGGSMDNVAAAEAVAMAVRSGGATWSLGDDSMSRNHGSRFFFRLESLRLGDLEPSVSRESSSTGSSLGTASGT